MKKLIIALILITASVLPVFSAETGATFTMGNNSLPAEPMTSAAFAGDEFPWGLSAYWKKAANDYSGIEIGFYMDPVLQNVGYTKFYYNEDLFNISVGPFFGSYNFV